MSEPLIAQRHPIVENLAPGSYLWCACGRSQSQPFCDGSHIDTDIEPLPFTIQSLRNHSLCACKHTHNRPFCDGTHKTLPPA